MRTLGCGICEYSKGKPVHLDGHTSALIDWDEFAKRWNLTLFYHDDLEIFDDFATAAVQYCPWCGRKLE